MVSSLAKTVTGEKTFSTELSIDLTTGKKNAAYYFFFKEEEEQKISETLLVLCSVLLQKEFPCENADTLGVRLA